MANHKSAKKATRQAEKRTIANRSRLNRIRTYMKKVEELTAANTTKEEAVIVLREAEKEMRRGVTKGLLHQNTVSRKISRMVKRVKGLFSAKA